MRPVASARGLVIPLVSVGLLVAAGIARADDSGCQTGTDGSQRAGLAFRAAISAWAYNEYWRLYGMGTTESRAALSEQDFLFQMEQGVRKPGNGAEILDVHTRGVYAVVRAKVRMEYKRYLREGTATRPLPTSPTDEVIQSVLICDEGEWRINLYQFVGMARH